MTWRELLLTSCAWIIALIAGVLSYAEVARSEPQTHMSLHRWQVAQGAQGIAPTLLNKT